MTCHMGCCPSYREHVLSVAVSAVATPTRRPETASTVERENRLVKDMAAYKSMRSNGVQPKGIDGCAALEARASTRLEVESAQVLTPTQRRNYEALTDKRADDGL